MSDHLISPEPPASMAHATGNRKRKVLVALATVLLAAAAYVALAVYLGGKVPAHATVGGVAVGGMSPTGAHDAVADAAAARMAAPVTVSTGNGQLELDPAASGLGIDVDRTLEGISGFTLDPVRIWQHLRGSVNRPFSVTVDQAALNTAVGGLSAKVNRSPSEGSITFPDAVVTVVEPVTGATLDVDATSSLIAAAWPRTVPVQARVTAVPPAVSAEEIARVKTAFADPAMSAPVTINAEGKTFEVEPADFAALLGFTSSAGVMQPTIPDALALGSAITAAGIDADVLAKPRNATVSFSGTTPSVTESVTGREIDTADLVTPFLAALTSSDRTVTVSTKDVEPEFTTAKVRATLPKEKISSFTTIYTGGIRWTNIEVAARRINGIYLEPGESFSLNETLGKRTPDKGYVKAGTIMNGALVDNYGGGISQVSTTLFNAVFFAGLQIDEHQPHSYYISRYPEGREATISWGTIDNRFTNDSPGGVLIRASASTSGMTVELWGTKVYDIQATKSPRRNIVQPGLIRDDSPTCLPQSPMEGFDVTVGRIFLKNGAEVKRQTFTTHYQPEVNRICTNPKAQ